MEVRPRFGGKAMVLGAQHGHYTTLCCSADVPKPFFIEAMCIGVPMHRLLAAKHALNAPPQGAFHLQRIKVDIQHTQVDIPHLLVDILKLIVDILHPKVNFLQLKVGIHHM
jgi:hypothetical protein